jgi:hypothetical protein
MLRAKPPCASCLPRHHADVGSMYDRSIAPETAMASCMNPCWTGAEAEPLASGGGIARMIPWIQ